MVRKKGCFPKSRTADRRKRKTRKRLSIKRFRAFLGMVPVAGVEPARCRHRRILNPVRLPIPSHRRVIFKDLLRMTCSGNRRSIVEVHEEIYKYRVVKNPVISRFFRLPTVDDAPDFESGTSANSITPALPEHYTWLPIGNQVPQPAFMARKALMNPSISPSITAWMLLFSKPVRVSLARV